MMRYVVRIVLPLLFIATAVVPAAEAEPIVAGTTVLPGEAIQDITLLPNTPFNPTGSSILISGVTGYGTITLNRDAEDPNTNTITIGSLVGGLFYGSNAMLGGSYVFGNIPPLTGADFSGMITNVVQDPNDPGFATGQPSSFQSGDFSFGGNSFGFEFLSPPFAGVTVFTDPSVPFSFSSTFDGLPPSAGTVLMNSGTDVLNIDYNGTPVAQSSNRRIIILSSVPEPSSLVLGGMAAIGVSCAVARRHRRRA
jgi:hypothetical protein